jgi:class 3 adenylate cyclase
MARLDAKTRAQLPDSAFAYVDSRGQRRLPINDASHVRNALARFDQVLFEDDAARDRARLRLLRAAQRHGVVPIGFVSAQLQPQRRLPKGHVTFLLTDIEGSTELLGRLGDGYAAVASTARKIARRAVRAAGGHEVDARGDEFFAAFAQAPAALGAAVAIQRALRAERWRDGAVVRMRMGLHSGRPSLTETGYVGLAVHAAARFCYGAHGGQIVLSSSARAGVLDALGDGVRLRSLGRWRFQGLREPEELFQVEAGDLELDFPPLRAAELVVAA